MEMEYKRDEEFFMSIPLLREQVERRKPLHVKITTTDSMVVGNSPIRISDHSPHMSTSQKLPETYVLDISPSSSSHSSSVESLSISSLATTSSSMSFSLSSQESVDTPPTSGKRYTYSVGSGKLDRDIDGFDSRRISLQDLYDMRRISITDFEFEQAQPITTSNVIKSGILYLKRTKNAIVKMDYNFILKPNMELHFHRADDYLDEEDSKVSRFCLAGCSITRSDTNQEEFELTYGLKRLFLGAQTVEIASEWINLLELHIAIAKNVFYEHVTFEGWLYKKGETIKNWRKRWCIIKEGVIYYYEDPFVALSNFHTHYKGKLDISDSWASVDDEREAGFKIHTENRTWQFYAATKDESIQWIKSIDEEKRAKQKRTFIQDGKIGIDPDVAVHKREIIHIKDDIEADDEVATHSDLKNVKEMMEINQFRYVRWMLTLLRHKVHERKQKQRILDIIEAEVTSIPSAFTVPVVIMLRFHIDKTTVVSTKRDALLRDVIDTALRKRSIDSVPENYVIKLHGQEKYVLNLDIPLWNLTYIRKMFIKGKSPIDLYLLRRDEIFSTMTSPYTSPILKNFKSPDNTPERDSISSLRLSQNKTIASMRSAIRNGSFIGKEKGPSFYKTHVLSPFHETEQMATRIEEDVIHINDLSSSKFFVKIVSVEGFTYSMVESEEINLARSDAKLHFYLEIGIYYGGNLIHDIMRTGKRLNTYWNEQKVTNIPFTHLPPETRIHFTFYCSAFQKNIPVAWVNCTLTDFTGKVKNGPMELSMWLDNTPHFLGTTEVNPSKQLLLNVIFPESPHSIIYPEFQECPPMLTRNLFEKQEVPSETRQEEGQFPETSELEGNTYPLEDFVRISKLDPLYQPTTEEKEKMWEYRGYLSDKVAIIPKLLLSANMDIFEQRKDLHQLVKSLPLLKPEMALQLLDYKYPDMCIRSYAVECISKMDDDTLSLYLLQLVQVLKYESFHISELACFLIERAILSPLKIGFLLFWHLQSETHLSNVKARFKMLQEALLLGLKPNLRTELLNQLAFVEELSNINAVMYKTPQQERKRVLQKLLEDIEIPARFTLPLDPTIVLGKLIIEKCRVMESAAHPMMLVFKNAEHHGDDYSVLCKFGDDLRQDALTLQMFTFMDRIWKAHDLDLQMSIYKCVSIGRNMGFIEVMPDSETTAKIQKEAGGVIGAFKQTPLHNWLREFNSSESSWTDVVEIFTRSCAACCVSTYVIGLGDRHNDNIMVTKSGGLFHIDFAHFLGNIMKFGVYKREKAPFVMTPEFAYVMGGEKSEQFKKFLKFCTISYNLLRKHISTFISFFGLMLFAGIPQLTSPDDLGYLRKSLSTHLSDEEAAKHFNKLIDESLKATSTQINFAFHIFANPD